MSDTRWEIPCDSTDTKYPRIIKFRDTERRGGVTRDCREEEIESHCLMGVGFQFGMMKKFWRWTVSMVAKQSECT